MSCISIQLSLKGVLVTRKQVQICTTMFDIKFGIQA